MEEGRTARDAGIDAVVAQGTEAGGHRGAFDPDRDAHLGTLDLARLLADDLDIPVIAAGGIMDGAGVAAALALGASAAQLGTAFVACPESMADPAYKAAILAGGPTVSTSAVSGRPARGLVNRLTSLDPEGVPAYPVAYDLGKALIAAGRAAGEAGWGAWWAGEGVGRARALPAGDLLRVLAEELSSAVGSGRPSAGRSP